MAKKFNLYPHQASAAAANAGPRWHLGMGLEPIFKRHHWPALVTDADTTADALCGYTLKWNILISPKKCVHLRQFNEEFRRLLCYRGSKKNSKMSSWVASVSTGASFVLYVATSAISNSIKFLNMFVTLYSFYSIRLNSHLRLFRRELLHEPFSPHNSWENRRCQCTHIVQCHPLLNLKVKVHTIVDQITGVNAPI